MIGSACVRNNRAGLSSLYTILASLSRVINFRSLCRLFWHGGRRMTDCGYISLGSGENEALHRSTRLNRWEGYRSYARHAVVRGYGVATKISPVPILACWMAPDRLAYAVRRMWQTRHTRLLIYATQQEDLEAAHRRVGSRQITAWMSFGHANRRMFFNKNHTLYSMIFFF